MLGDQPGRHYAAQPHRAARGAGSTCGRATRVRNRGARTRSGYFSVMVMLPSTQLMLPSSNSLCLPPGTVVSSLVG